MRPTVFIHTNRKQIVGAIVSEYSLKRNAANPDSFDVRVINHQDQAFLQAKEGEAYLRDGVHRVWRNDDLQSFTPLRFMPPELMGYEGRALVIDPDIFSVRDVGELLARDMQGKALMCRPRSGSKEKRGHFASSVMLLDCAKLTHWNCQRDFEALFTDERDYMTWISLQYEDRESIGLFENHWNDFDRLTPETRLLHNTKRKTQPWKTGLPVDFMPPEKPSGVLSLGLFNRVRRRLLGDYALLGHYKAHPDPNQERFFFGLLRECIDQGIVTEAMLREEMRQNHVRHDAFEVLDRTPRLAA
ncbi:hypothetical protein [Oceanibacterium hippocampi]|uniref:Uncharacterized protein n=1 Tax=Oceanibacterium hippocampi TaxID=745714 RepID=A0A1Y5U3W8_9PROT|nr:hypothetical protein [Oceanibacterium hippocampi]SLN76237.1 hypothetical protein OCH7691_04073 [Oceanibacterium hippocampi]